MANLDTFPGTDECIFCYGKVRPATRQEVEARRRTASPEYRAAVEWQEGTWNVCTRCGPGSATKWQSIALEELWRAAARVNYKLQFDGAAVLPAAIGAMSFRGMSGTLGRWPGPRADR